MSKDEDFDMAVARLREKLERVHWPLLGRIELAHKLVMAEQESRKPWPRVKRWLRLP